MKYTIAVVLLVSLTLSPMAPPARACGGPEMDDIVAPLQPPEAILEWLTVSPCEGDSTCAFVENLATIPQLLFLNPFHVGRPNETQDLWRFSYESNGTTDAQGHYVEYQLPEALGTESLDDALKAGSLEKAVSEAQSLFDRIMNMPAALAENNRDGFEESLEVLELKPISGNIPPDAWKYYFSIVRPDYWPGFIALSDPKLPQPLKEALTVVNIRRDRAEALAKTQPTNPRLGTLRFIALKEAMRTQIPDGWKEEIQKKVSPNTWTSLEALHDQWLKDFPSNPLADLVRLSKLRLYYLKGEDRKAWQVVFDIYARRPIRALGEMRFLLKQGLLPNSQDVPQDPILLAALAPWFDYKNDGKLWTHLWRISEANLSTPWAVNFQERLLNQAVLLVQKGQPLLEGFPETPKNPSPLWGQFRLVALYKAGRYDQALVEAESLKPNAQVAAVQAKLYLMRREWAKVMGLEKLPLDSKKYLLRVLLDDDALKSLVDFPQKDIQSEARIALATHLASKGDWNSGATLIEGVNPAKAALWRDAAKLRLDRSPAGLLAWARFLRKNDGKLFYPPDTVWYRSLFARLSTFEYDVKTPPASPAEGHADPAIPWNPDQESKLLTAHLQALEPSLALKAYGAWLEKSGGKDPQAATVLKEADKTYNWLVNWANNYSDAWKALLDKGPEAAAIRKAGLEMRSK